MIRRWTNKWIKEVKTALFFNGLTVDKKAKKSRKEGWYMNRKNCMKLIVVSLFLNRKEHKEHDSSSYVEGSLYHILKDTKKGCV
jgi:hypothetical protein